ncbi:MAG: hypothetical protein AAFX54_01535 [Pseudomonadota bacterium]
MTNAFCVEAGLEAGIVGVEGVASLMKSKTARCYLANASILKLITDLPVAEQERRNWTIPMRNAHINNWVTVP